MEIICFIFKLIPDILLMISIPYLLISVIGFFTRKKRFPYTDDFLKYAIIIAARNESKVIKSSIESIKSAENAELIDIFVIAHNCTDNTAEIAESAGAQVIRYNNSNEKTKGFAIRHMVDKLIGSGKINEYDGFFIIDADNLVRKDFFVKMNDAFVFEGRKSVINSYQNARNFNQSMISVLYGVFQISNIIQEHRPRAALNISSRIRGTSYLVPTQVLKNGFNFTSLTEDWDLCGYLVLNGVKITHCNEAEFYDEQPSSVKVMLRQRLRWSAGYLFVVKKYFFKLIKALFSPQTKRRMSVYDFFVSVVPYPIVLVFNDILFLVVSLVGAMFGIPFKAMMLRCLKIIITKYCYFYVIECILTARCFIFERKHIKGVSFGRKVMATFLYPLFFLVSFPLQMVALFSKNITWKEIPHLSNERPDKELN